MDNTVNGKVTAIFIIISILNFYFKRKVSGALFSTHKYN